VAIRAGRILSERLFNKQTDLKMSYKYVPTVIFSHPPIGEVGYHEEAARKKFGDDKVKIYKGKFTNMFYSLADDDKHKLGSLFKLICNVEENGTERVVGVHGIGKGIDEMMQAIGVVLVMNGTKQDFDNCVAIHPTASEELVLMDAKLLF